MARLDDDEPAALQPLPARFTSDLSLTDADVRELLTYLELHGAVAAAGDGVGLNWFRRRP